MEAKLDLRNRFRRRMRFEPVVNFFAAFRKAEQGATTTLVAVALPAMLGAFGGAVDYAALTGAKSQATILSESAALSIGREMTLGMLTPDRVQSLAAAHVQANLGSQSGDLSRVSGKIIGDGMQVRVEVALNVKLPVGLLSQFVDTSSVSASAVVRTGQQSKLCLLSLSEAKGTFGTYQIRTSTGVEIRNGARLTATGCIVHSNVNTNMAIKIMPTAYFKGDVVCAVGAVQKLGGMVEGDLISNCPKLANPLETRPLPPEASQGCKHSSPVIMNAGTNTLLPGVYCEDVIISKTARVTMAPGVYVFRNRLIVTDSAELRGDGVGLFFAGIGSFFSFLNDAYIDLTAPTSGSMAGLLMWEDARWAQFDRGGAFHQINSSRAKRLTGTIYLPAGRLLIDSKRSVADASEFTVLVVNRVDIADGPNLVLNSNYNGTSVPVPPGLGPLGAKNVRLESSN